LHQKEEKQGNRLSKIIYTKGLNRGRQH